MGGPMAWERRQWAALVGVLLLVILLLVITWPKPQPAPADHVVIQISDGPKVLSTQVVPLR